MTSLKFEVARAHLHKVQQHRPSAHGTLARRSDSRPSPRLPLACDKRHCSARPSKKDAPTMSLSERM